MVREYIKTTAGNSEIPHYYNALLVTTFGSFCLVLLIQVRNRATYRILQRK